MARVKTKFLKLAGQRQMKIPVSYALDIGVYETGPDDKVAARTTAAWCRVDSDVKSLKGLKYNPEGHFEMKPAGQECRFACGKNLKKLARLIANDLKNREKVALGFEAPMWLPLADDHREGIDLFPPRFKAEEVSGKRFPWYGQSGAAASIKAIPLGRLLRDLLKKKLGQCPPISTTVEDTVAGGLVLFEAFVAGEYKVRGEESVGMPPNEWDALIAALAWRGRHGGLKSLRDAEPVPLHRAGSRRGSTLSLWSVVFPEKSIVGPPDCEVIAMKQRGPR